ncbi:uncharacterized protein [Musca autumnalis]|uniref:uncharacterized protein n=1 Tax=Musca autumnalis TaxID=221902 RepID=UPI003CEF3C0F
MNITNLLNYGISQLEDTQINLYYMNAIIAQSLCRIILDFFIAMAKSFIIVVSTRRKKTFYMYLNVLEYVFNMIPDLNVQLVFIDHQNPQCIDGPRFYNLLLIDSYQAFLDIDPITYTEHYDTSEYYHIFLLQHDHLIMDDMQQIFNYCWANQIVNCNIQLQNRHSELHLYSYFPYGAGSCNNTEPRHINQFVNGNWLRQPYFLPKTMNFYGCPLRGVVRCTSPYVYRSDDNVEGEFTGFEVALMKELARVLNFTLILQEAMEDDRNYPALNGGLIMLANRSVDFVFGYYRKRPMTTNDFTNTAPHYQSSVIGAIYLRAHIFNTAEVLSYPFRSYSWAAIVACAAGILILTRLMRLLLPKSMRTFSMLTCAFGLPVREKIQHHHTYFLFGPWIWATFLLRSMYSGMLYYLFSNDIYQKLPTSLEDATNRSYVSVMNHFTFNDVMDIPFYRNHHRQHLQPIILNSSDELIAIKYLEENLSRKTYAVISKDFLLHYAQESEKVGMYYMIPETIMKQQLVIYFTKHTILAEQFDKTMMDLKASGLLRYYMQQFFDTGTGFNSYKDEDKMIKQNDLLGIYVICGALHVLAIFIFLLELLSMKLKKLRKLFD